MELESNVGLTKTDQFTCLEGLQRAHEYNTTGSITLDYCGKEKCLPNHLFGPYVRKDYVIHFIIDGKGTYFWKNKKYDLKKGDAFLIYPEEETIYKADGKEPWRYYWIGFHGYRSEEFLDQMGFSRNQPVIQVQNLNQVERHIDRILLANKLTCANELVRLSELLALFSYIMEERPKVDTKKTEYPGELYVRYALEYMMNHYSEKMKIDDLADIIGISRSYFTGIFKKEVKMSPQEYLINLRLEKAAALLRSSEESVQTIAQKSGYEDSLSFSKVFKQKYGMSPKMFRAEKVELVLHENKYNHVEKYPL
jgi:AraC-like DNA-binding protein